MSPELPEKIIIELASLRNLLDKYHSLLEDVHTRIPTDVELIALAGILHSFYTGFENIFKRIAQDLDGGFKQTSSWHADLLEEMVMATNKRPNVITEELKIRLQYYLSFRHAFRSVYSYDLNWSKMQDLVYESTSILQHVETELQLFIKKMLSHS